MTKENLTRMVPFVNPFKQLKKELPPRWSTPFIHERIEPARPFRSKIPMQKTIIDSECNIFNYRFENGKTIFTYIGSTFLEE